MKSCHASHAMDRRCARLLVCACVSEMIQGMYKNNEEKSG